MSDFNKKEYFDSLKDPRWQKKRLEVMKRDCFSCRICGDSESTLNVHHRMYDRTLRFAWEYEERFLVTLCESCHEEEKKNMNDAVKHLISLIRQKFFSNDVMEIAKGLELESSPYPPEVVASIIRFSIDPEKGAGKVEHLFWESKR